MSDSFWLNPEDYPAAPCPRCGAEHPEVTTWKHIVTVKGVGLVHTPGRRCSRCERVYIDYATDLWIQAARESQAL